MAELHPLLKIGTSSWSNADWPFYPKGSKPADYLALYAMRFPIVEVDSSFYHAPSRAMCERWNRAVPDSFRFALKVPRTITHDKPLELGREWSEFVSVIDPLKGKLSHLLLQFPYFARSSIYPDLSSFLRSLGPFLADAVPPCSLVVEVRNKTWVGEDLFALLRGQETVFAITEQDWMPKPRELWAKYGSAIVTGSSAYIRLLGEHKRIETLTKTWDRLVIDRIQETQETLSVVRLLLQKPIPIHILINNHFGGYAVASIELLEKLWNEGSGLPS